MAKIPLTGLIDKHLYTWYDYITPLNITWRKEFCMPGRGCSYTFLKNFVQLCFDIVQCGGAIQISQDYSSMVNFARCKCLGANVLRGKDQKPWDGKLEYDYQLWIDNDIVFNTRKFL